MSRTPQERGTAAVLLSPGQWAGCAVLVALIGAQAIQFGPLSVLKGFVACVTVFYVVFVGLKLSLWWAASRYKPATYPTPAADDANLPRYTILVPLMGEANVVERLVKALTRLVYPTNLLQILLITEAVDQETNDAIRAMNLPPQFQVVTVPDVGPRTKPKACSYAYQYVTGDCVVIYDAEDRPHWWQLLLAVGGFRYWVHVDRTVACLQARLVFWNPRPSWVSSFYWAEYRVHFTKVLTGLAKLKLIPPLGGTSNHFRREALDAVANAIGRQCFQNEETGEALAFWGPWDSSNVTEDADLAARLTEAGYRVEMLDSVTYEEAPASVVPTNSGGFLHRLYSAFAGWLKGLETAKNQRSRWLKGYGQTGLVHLRRPIHKIRDVGLIRWLVFELFMLGTFFSILLNPIMWATTALYVVARLDSLPAVSRFIEALFPAPVYYAGMLVAVMGNACLFYQKLVVPLYVQEQAESVPADEDMHELAAHLHTEEYGLTLRLLFIPLWWAFTSVSAYRALRTLLIPSQRTSWAKTKHGHHDALEHRIEQAALPPRSAPLGQLTSGTTNPYSVEGLLAHPQGEEETA